MFAIQRGGEPRVCIYVVGRNFAYQFCKISRKLERESSFGEFNVYLPKEPYLTFTFTFSISAFSSLGAQFFRLGV